MEHFERLAERLAFERRLAPAAAVIRELDRPPLGRDSTYSAVGNGVGLGSRLERDRVAALARPQMRDLGVFGEEVLDRPDVGLVGGELRHARSATRAVSSKRPENVHRNGCASFSFQWQMKPITAAQSSARSSKLP